MKQSKVSDRDRSQHAGPRQPLPIVRVPFQGEEVLAGQDPGGGDPEENVWIIIKRVCDSLGVDNAGQQKRLKGEAWATVEMKSMVAEDGKTREMLCINLRSLPLWLATIEASRVAEEVRPKLLAFQLHCRDVLYRHFFDREEPRPEPAPAPAPLPDPLPSGVIGRRNAAVYILGPLRDLAHLTAEVMGTEKEQKRALRQIRRCHKLVNDELRVHLGYPLAAAMRWEKLSPEQFAKATQYIGHMSARLIAMRCWKGEREGREAQQSLFGAELARTQKDALGKRGAN